MTAGSYHPAHYPKVRGTEISATDSPQQYREKLARIALDEMYQFVSILDPQGTLLEVNRSALDGAGLQRSDVEGKPFWKCFWWALSAESQDTLKSAIARAAQGEFIRYDVEIYGKAAGRETIIIDFSMIPVKDDNGKVVFIVPEGRDITEKKAYEREVAAMNADLQALLERIRELDEIKSQFFANVSHELRTPLALIIGPAERLTSADATRGPEEQRESARVILRNARMLLKHVNDLLDISKLEAGKLTLRLCDTDVAALVRLTASHFDLLAAERRVTFSVDIADEYFAAVDPEKLPRVVMNLLSNAFKFTPIAGTIRCTLRTSGNDIILSVEDSGTGVRPEMRRAIFERFRQADGGAHREFGGTGLGLAIAHEFVGMHNGRIEVLGSALGGALFQVTFPAIHLPAVETERLRAADLRLDRGTLDGLIEELRVPSFGETNQPLARPATAKATILVVEDNPDMNRFVAQCLSADYHVICAFDGKQGLEKALAFHPALIVSDIMMPGVSGIELLSDLRQRPELVDTPVLLLSAVADEAVKNRMLQEGAQDFVSKPFSEQDLLARVRNLMIVKNRRDTEQANQRFVEAANRELQLRTSELSALFEQTPSFMVVLRGPQHTIELANAAFHKLVGRGEGAGRRELVGASFAEAFPEAVAQGFLELLDRVYATATPYVGSAVRLLMQREPGAQPEELFINFVYQPLLAGKSGVAGVFMEGHDITEQKRAEEALRLADRRKDEFLATLAHELRNPLQPIRLAATISRTADATEAQRKWSHEVIDRQLGHMGRLLDELLEVSRISQGKIALRTEHMVLQDGLAAAVETARPLIENRGHTLTLALPTVPVHIDADPVRFAQLFTNLLTNSAKYTDAGGVIEVQAKVADKSVVVTVKDNGIGISAELLPRLFEMFSQAKAGLERSEGGLGIGLWLVHALVELHGGTIEARSPGIGMGSEFAVTLPLLPAEARLGPSNGHGASNGTSNGASSGTARLNLKRLRVLVADDNRDNADGCTALLRMAGHDVRTAYSGLQALTIATEFAPQAAILDIAMPELNGYDVARRIRAAKGGDSMLLVAVSGWSQPEARSEARAAGFDEHLAKPVDFAVLQTLISEFPYAN